MLRLANGAVENGIGCGECNAVVIGLHQLGQLLNSGDAVVTGDGGDVVGLLGASARITALTLLKPLLYWWHPVSRDTIPCFVTHR